ncbi:hypothetical protein GJU40_18830 [Bacillus lacus]|uniref:Uncharacterized protein n=1 Tax=Metabacillus lacus TaxID=1983721 RepID=A0A7X2LZ24_9BACI|nr:hypothetical protein [Metabacillus lacus]MRX74180.1 hypothetical protein [Metabacillus lacus]
MTAGKKPGQYQDNHEQYRMPDALKQEKDYSYRVGYESTTGNETSPDHTVNGKTNKS